MPAKASSPEQVREISLSEMHSFKKHPYISAFMHFGLSLHTKECTENTAYYLFTKPCGRRTIDQGKVMYMLFSVSG